MDLKLVQIEFHIKFEGIKEKSEQFVLALRNFDVLFKLASCSAFSESCAGCDNRFSCPFYDVFAQRLSSDPQIVRRHQKPPLPYVFKISRIFNSCSCLELGLVVFGSAIQHIDTFIKTVKMIVSSTGKFCLGLDTAVVEAFCRDYQNANQQLNLSCLDYVLLSSRDLMEGTISSDSLELVIESPLRLVSSGSLLYKFDFSTFLRSQMRRSSALFAYYGDGELDLDYAGLSEDSKRVSCLKDGICFVRSHLNQSYRQPGLLGAAIFEPVSQVMLSLVKLGTYFNAGKGATMGYGEYVINV